MTRKLAKAAVLFERAARRGSLHAALLLAGMLERGDGVPADAAKAEELRRRVLDRGGVAALCRLAEWCGRGGGGLPVDAVLESRVAEKLEEEG